MEEITKKDERAKFLEPETRSGVYISADKKLAWKCMLDILEIFMRVCDKYDLEWSMDGGSLIGAIRHKGFVPWDDDIDVVMPRKDYDKLQQVLPKELPTHLFMQTSKTDPELLTPILKIRNKNTCGIDPYHANNHVCMNMGIMVDVDPIDVDPVDVTKRDKLRRHDFFYRGIRSNAFAKSPRGISARVKHIIGSVLYKVIGNNLLYWLRERPYRVMALRMPYAQHLQIYPGQVGYVARCNRKAEWFKEYMVVPFEYLKVKVPVAYDAILTQNYGDWRTPSREGSQHGTLILDAKRCYKDVLIEKFGYTKSELSNLK